MDKGVKKDAETGGVIEAGVRVLVAALLIVCMTACGRQADTAYEMEQEKIPGSAYAAGTESETADTPETESEKENTLGTENGIEEGNEAEKESDGSADETAAAEADEEKGDLSEAADAVVVYVTETIEFSDEIFPAQYADDLSLLESLKYTGGTYAYQDGNVYYRRYHEDSYEEAALWGDYAALPGFRKEIVCIDPDGREKVLFTDEGYGDIYLINDRFYMTGWEAGENGEGAKAERRLYSVDMQGNDRIDYGEGSIFAIDRVRNILILMIWEEDDTPFGGYFYYAMDVETGERTRIELNGSYITAMTYRDGWFYYVTSDEDVRRLCAVSLEGEKREIIALTSDANRQQYSYRESILQLEVDGDRIYFIWGGYDGTASVFQGGRLISIRLDGTDYKAVDTEWDTFYLSHVNEKTLIYYPCHYHSFPADPNIEYDMYVWDIEEDKCFFSDFPREIFEGYCAQAALTRRYDPKAQGALTEWRIYGDDPQTNIYAVPDDSGRIIRLVMDLESCYAKWQGEESDVKYGDWYYADGFLYFCVEYRVYDRESSVGWRDGYRRLRTEGYRLKIGENAAQMLYSF